MFLIIFSQLKYLIQRVYQINYGKTYTVKRQPEYLGQDYVNQNLVDPLHSLKIKCNQPQQFSVWPTMLQPCYVKPFNCFPNLNCKKYIYKYDITF